MCFLCVCILCTAIDTSATERPHMIILRVLRIYSLYRDVQISAKPASMLFSLCFATSAHKMLSK